MNTDLTHVVLTYGFCGLLVMLYASARFNTPATNRSSTIQLWYWQGLFAYMASCVALFIVLSIILEQPALRDFLLKLPLPATGGVGGASPPPVAQAEPTTIPPALAATLVMTALLPSVPYIKSLDSALLAFFLRMACIPAEVTRRSKILTHDNLLLAGSDLPEIARFIHNAPIPDEAIDLLRATAGSESEESELRFTKVLLAFRRLDELPASPKYSKFFSENAAEYDSFRKSMFEFAGRSVKGLIGARRLREVADKSVYEELISEKRETFKRECIERFEAVSLFLARAILHCEMGERDVRERLHGIGFSVVSVSRPFIPIHQLVLLCAGILVYLLLTGVALHPSAGTPGPAVFRWLPFLVAVSHVLTIGLTLWFMQTVAWARRDADGGRPYGAYLLSGVFNTAVVLVLCTLWNLARIGSLPGGDGWIPLLVLALLCGLLCVFVAFACDDLPPRIPEPLWFRSIEAVGCSLATLCTTWLLMQLFLLPGSGAPSSWITVFLPAGTALFVGFFIPEIYRAGLRRSVNGDGPPPPSSMLRAEAATLSGHGQVAN